MHGHVSKFRADLGVGIIHTEDGRKFRFHMSEVRAPARQMIGQEVDFEISDARHPHAIILMSASPWAAFG
jgi:cold shock CspA family protein